MLNVTATESGIFTGMVLPIDLHLTLPVPVPLVDLALGQVKALRELLHENLVAPVRVLFELKFKYLVLLVCQSLPSTLREFVSDFTASVFEYVANGLVQV